MKTINQIKDCQAIELGYNSFRDLVLNPKQDMKMNHLNWCIESSMEEYAEQFKPKWIPVTERLPDSKPLEQITVLVFGDWNNEAIAQYQHGIFYGDETDEDTGNSIDITNLVTHWMPLPYLIHLNNKQ